MSSSARHPGKVFLSVDDIANCLNDYLVFDVRYSLCDNAYGKTVYATGHLPASIFVDVDEELSGPLTNTTARHPLPDPEKFVEWCKSKGIGSGKPILCYDDMCGAMGACRLWWMLHALGIDAYVLNGGYQFYHAAGLPLETGPAEATTEPVREWPYGTTFSRALTIDKVPPNAIMVDTRSTCRFATTVRPYGPDPLPGHIENAVSFPWDWNILCNGQFKCLKSEEECRDNLLKALQGVLDAGHSDVSSFVFYCGSGVTATLNIALTCHLGFAEPFLYCGSWSEYAGVFAFAISRGIIEKHSMLLNMMSQSLAGNPKVTSSENVTIMVDGNVVQHPDDEVMAAVAHMHVGEKARVFFKSQRVVVIEVAHAE